MVHHREPQWTKTNLTTLMHALVLSPPDAPSLLPQSAAKISATLRELSVSLNNPPHWAPHRHARAVLKRATGLSPPPKPRRKKQSPAPRHRVSLQLVPATPADDAAVRAVAAYPFVEVVLKAGRRVWDVVQHLYLKWGLPVTVEVGGKSASVDARVVDLVERGCRTVRLPYRVVRVDVDWTVLKGAVEEPGVAVRRRRVVALREDDAFWTGLFDAQEGAQEGGCEFASHDGGDGNGQAVMSRLRGHLEKLDRSGDAETGAAATGAAEDDPAVIPERFLRSCSRFDFAHPLPDSLLSLGKSDSTDAGGAGGAGGADVNPLQVMNDALDLRPELDLRCEEQLNEDVEFLFKEC